VRRRRYGKDVDTLESRFVIEIPEELITRKEIYRGEEEPVDEDTAADFLAQMRAKFASD